MHRWPFLNAEEMGGRPHRGKKRRCKKRIGERKRYSCEKPQKKKKKREKRMRLIITIREGRGGPFAYLGFILGFWWGRDTNLLFLVGHFVGKSGKANEYVVPFINVDY